MLDNSVALSLLACAVAAAVFLRLRKGPNLDLFPTAGPRSFLELCVKHPKFIDTIQEGYEKYKSTPFKVLAGHSWMVVFSKREHLQEIRKAPDEALTFYAASDEVMKTRFTMGNGYFSNGHQAEATIRQLAQNVAVFFEDIQDEVAVAFDHFLKFKDDEWEAVSGLHFVEQTVCRVTHRLFVGLPLCRNPAWLDLNVKYSHYVDEEGAVLKSFPPSLSPFIALFLNKCRKTRVCAAKVIAPIVEERVKLIQTHGKDWDGKPNDMLQWLVDWEVDSEGDGLRFMAHRVMSISFGANHTSSHSFTQALFFLAAHPQYIQPLREEVETIAQEEGWTKTSLAKMRKIDSFMKESQRLTGIAFVSLLRKTTQDFTLSDGTLIPNDTLMIAPSHSLHHDEEIYPNAHVFDPFRFSNMREEGGEGTKHQFVTTTPEYLPFGHGKHACPGRFLASNILKTMLAKIVVQYDIKLATPPGKVLSYLNVAPDPSAKILFRRRKCTN